MEDASNPRLTDFLGVPPTQDLRERVEHVLYASQNFTQNVDTLRGIYAHMVSVSLSRSEAETCLRHRQSIFCMNDYLCQADNWILAPFITAAVDSRVYRISVGGKNKAVVFFYDADQETGFPMDRLRLRYVRERYGKSPALQNYLTDDARILSATVETARMLAARFDTVLPPRDYTATLLEQGYCPTVGGQVQKAQAAYASNILMRSSVLIA
ncbi:MAG: hypothetical protein PHD48_02375 [Alphaproteobacteria bacterium]|nr:hypothetical protein [Alphaproteobacteria bacterium]